MVKYGKLSRQSTIKLNYCVKKMQFDSNFNITNRRIPGIFGFKIILALHFIRKTSYLIIKGLIIALAILTRLT
jgi:hypothetical protein